MKSILCYGDSNTWGFVPGAFADRERFDRNTRWTGRLQQLLGQKEFYVIEEGLNRRTTNVDYQQDAYGFRGTEFISVILYTHAPLDLAVIMLGTNDFKKEFNRTTQQIAGGIKELIDMIRSTNYGPNMKKSPPILVISPPLPVKTECQHVVESFFQDSDERAQTLARDLKAVVDEYPEDVYFVDAAPRVESTPIDGIHLDKQAHENLSILIHEKIREIFNS